MVSYCTALRSGTHNVGVSLAGAAQRVTGALPFTAPFNGTGCSLPALQQVCSGIGCGGNGCGTCDHFQNQRCGSGVSAVFPGLAIGYDGTGYACEDGPPVTRPVAGERIENCYSGCTIPGKCCQTLNSTLWVCQASNYFCGDFGKERRCDNSRDCTPGSYCCSDRNGGLECALQCSEGSTSCRVDEDCAMWGGHCGSRGFCESDEDAGGP